MLDYGSWVAGLSHDDVLSLFEAYRPGVPFEQAFVEQLGTNPPDEINAAQTLTVIASDVDPATEWIVRYLNGGFDVPVNVVFFRYFHDGDNEYLARTWLMDDDSAIAKGVGPTKKRGGGKEPWNGQDWYVSFGELSDGRLWKDGRRYGFVSAGGGVWFSRTLRSLPIAARVFVCIPKTGYVGVGTVLAEAQRFDEAVVTYEGEQRRLMDLPLSGSYAHSPGGGNDETAEYVVPIAWISGSSQSSVVTSG